MGRVNTLIKTLLNALLIPLISLISGLALANSDNAGVGTETCLACHEGMHEPAISALKQSYHGVLFYQETTRSDACESCHGPGGRHAKNPKTHPLKPSSNACLGCHKEPELAHWESGVHENASLQCMSCHKLHEQAGNQYQRGGLQTNTSQCIDCHTRQRAELHMPSRHPIAEGTVQCMDCHNPHGSLAPAQLRQPTLNNNCYQCHAEKRGPHLFEHTPVTEDCSSCHKAHGSVHKALLKSRPPFLCQQCHMAAGHVSVAPSGSNLSGNANLLGKNCMNCHSEVHGSNHPSGARLTR